jgi:chemotaxis protein methyltransferase CheR
MMNELIKTIARQVKSQTLADVLCYDDVFLLDTIRKRIELAGSLSLHEYADSLGQNPAEISALLDSLQVGYSRFFRNPLTFSVLQMLIIPSLIQRKRKSKRKEIRIWSAACAAGQEAYSTAMLLDEALNCNGNDICYRIFATDSNPAQIAAALSGRYIYENLANLSIKMFDRWIKCDGGMCVVSESLKENISFSVFDMLNEELKSPPESIFGEFDLIFFANILMYYKDECRDFMISKLKHNLATDGLIVCSETERDFFLKHGFCEVYPFGCVFSQDGNNK